MFARSSPPLRRKGRQLISFSLGCVMRVAFGSCSFSTTPFSRRTNLDISSCSPGLFLFKKGKPLSVFKHIKFSGLDLSFDDCPFVKLARFLPSNEKWILSPFLQVRYPLPPHFYAARWNGRRAFPLGTLKILSPFLANAVVYNPGCGLLSTNQIPVRPPLSLSRNVRSTPLFAPLFRRKPALSAVHRDFLPVAGLGFTPPERRPRTWPPPSSFQTHRTSHLTLPPYTASIAPAFGDTLSPSIFSSRSRNGRRPPSTCAPIDEDRPPRLVDNTTSPTHHLDVSSCVAPPPDQRSRCVLFPQQQ